MHQKVAQKVILKRIFFLLEQQTVTMPRCCDATQLIIYIIIVCSNSVYALASLFLPKVFLGKDIPGFWSGLVFSMYSIAVVLVSPFIGTLVTRCGYKNLLAVGLVAMGISIIPIGFLMKIENDVVTLAVGLVLRALQGTASATINTTCYSLAANKYADQTEFIVGMLEGVSGIGLVIGLLGGSFIYEKMGYMAVFLVFGSLLLVMSCVSRLVFGCIERREQEQLEQRRRDALLLSPADGNELDQRSESIANETPQVGQTNLNESVLSDRQHSTQGESFSYKLLFSEPRVVFAMMSATMSNVVYAQTEPILVLRLADFETTTM